MLGRGRSLLGIGLPWLFARVYPEKQRLQRVVINPSAVRKRLQLPRLSNLILGVFLPVQRHRGIQLEANQRNKN